MTITVHGDGFSVNFPDDTDHATIDRVMREAEAHHTATVDSQRTWGGAAYEGMKNLPSDIWQGVKGGVEGAAQYGMEAVNDPYGPVAHVAKSVASTAGDVGKTALGGFLNIPSYSMMGGIDPSGKTIGEGLLEKIPALAPFVKEAQGQASDVGKGLYNTYWGEGGQGLRKTIAEHPAGLLTDIATLGMGGEGLLAKAARLPAKVSLAVPRAISRSVRNDRLGAVAKGITDESIAVKPGAMPYNMAPDLAAEARRKSPAARSMIDRAISNQMDPAARLDREEAAKLAAFGPEGARFPRKRDLAAAVEAKKGADILGVLPQRVKAQTELERQQQRLRAFRLGEKKVPNPETEPAEIRAARQDFSAKKAPLRVELPQDLVAGVSKGARQHPLEDLVRPRVRENIDAALGDRGAASNTLLDRAQTERKLASDAGVIGGPVTTPKPARWPWGLAGYGVLTANMPLVVSSLGGTALGKMGVAATRGLSSRKFGTIGRMLTEGNPQELLNRVKAYRATNPKALIREEQALTAWLESQRQRKLQEDRR